VKNEISEGPVFWEGVKWRVVYFSSFGSTALRGRTASDQKQDEGAHRARSTFFRRQPNLSPFNPQAAAVGIRGTVGAVGIPGAEGIVD